MKMNKYLIIISIIFSVLVLISTVNAADVSLETQDFEAFKMVVPEGSNFVEDENYTWDYYNTTSSGEEFYEKILVFRNEGETKDEISNVFYYTFSKNLKDEDMDRVKYQSSDMLSYNCIEEYSNMAVYEIPEDLNKSDKYMAVYYVDGNADDFNQCVYIYGNDLNLIKESIDSIKFSDTYT